MPLQDAVSYLKDYHGIEIQLDTRALEDNGIGSDTPVNRMFNGTPLNTALQLVLDDLDLTYHVGGGVLLITTKEELASTIELRVYDVDELVGSGTSADEVAALLNTLCGDGKGDDKTVDGLRIVPFHNLLVVRASQRDQQELVRLLTQIKDKLREE